MDRREFLRKTKKPVAVGCAACVVGCGSVLFFPQKAEALGCPNFGGPICAVTESISMACSGNGSNCPLA